jgi:hypothetical protein
MTHLEDDQMGLRRENMALRTQLNELMLLVRKQKLNKAPKFSTIQAPFAELQSSSSDTDCNLSCASESDHDPSSDSFTDSSAPSSPFEGDAKPVSFEMVEELGFLENGSEELGFLLENELAAEAAQAVGPAEMLR